MPIMCLHCHRLGCNGSCQVETFVPDAAVVSSGNKDNLLRDDERGDGMEDSRDPIIALLQTRLREAREEYTNDIGDLRQAYEREREKREAAEREIKVCHDTIAHYVAKCDGAEAGWAEAKHEAQEQRERADELQGACDALSKLLEQEGADVRAVEKAHAATRAKLEAEERRSKQLASDLVGVGLDLIAEQRASSEWVERARVAEAKLARAVPVVEAAVRATAAGGCAMHIPTALNALEAAVKEHLRDLTGGASGEGE